MWRTKFYNTTIGDETNSIIYAIFGENLPLRMKNNLYQFQIDIHKNYFNKLLI